MECHIRGRSVPYHEIDPYHRCLHLENDLRCDGDGCYYETLPGPWYCRRSFCRGHDLRWGYTCIHPNIPRVVADKGLGEPRRLGPRPTVIYFPNLPPPPPMIFAPQPPVQANPFPGREIVVREICIRPGADGNAQEMLEAARTGMANRDKAQNEQYEDQASSGTAPQRLALQAPPDPDNDEQPSGGGRVIEDVESSSSEEEQRRRRKAAKKPRRKEYADEEERPSRSEPPKAAPAHRAKVEFPDEKKKGSGKRDADEEDEDIAEAIRRSLADMNMGGGVYEAGSGSRHEGKRKGKGKGEKERKRQEAEEEEEDLPPAYDP
jgi:hypothetical protein